MFVYTTMKLVMSLMNLITSQWLHITQLWNIVFFPVFGYFILKMNFHSVLSSINV